MKKNELHKFFFLNSYIQYTEVEIFEMMGHQREAGFCVFTFRFYTSIYIFLN